MTKKEYLELHQQLCNRMVEITKKKNADYTGASDDPFANFRQSSNFIQGIPQVTEIGFFTRMSDKFARVGSFISLGVLQVAEETVEDALLDLANYCILFIGYLREKRGWKPPVQIVNEVLEAYEESPGPLVNPEFKPKEFKHKRPPYPMCDICHQRVGPNMKEICKHLACPKDI